MSPTLRFFLFGWLAGAAVGCSATTLVYLLASNR